MHCLAYKHKTHNENKMLDIFLCQIVMLSGQCLLFFVSFLRVRFFHTKIMKFGVNIIVEI